MSDPERPTFRGNFIHTPQSVHDNSVQRFARQITILIQNDGENVVQETIDVDDALLILESRPLNRFFRIMKDWNVMAHSS